MKLNCIIIDDEPLARKGLREYISEIDFLELRGEFDNPMKAADIISSNDVHLLLLDIQMPKITGLDFLKSLAAPPMTILTTAYPEYALQGYELNVVDYLLKPFSFERFLKAVMKAKSHFESGVKKAEVAEADHFFVKCDGRIVKIAHDDVLFVEALQNYIAVHTTEKKFIVYLTIKAVEEQLPAARFIKVHKSYIVAADKVAAIEGNEIVISNQRIPISRNSKDEVIERILNNKLLKR